MSLRTPLFAIAVALLLAGDAAAFVQPGLLPGEGHAYGHRPAAHAPYRKDVPKGIRGQHGAGDGPVDPVPEPTTVALTALGLVALGVAAKRRRVV